MSESLSLRERELVALGAALGSNCTPCVEFHIPQARKAGLTDAQIAQAIQLADSVRQVPARKVLEASLQLVGYVAPAGNTGPGCGSAPSSGTSSACCG